MGNSIDKNGKYLYLPGLDGIRAFAASLVIFVHFNQFAYLFGLSGFYHQVETAGIAVTVFFVLSGFLITYLLLEEKLKFGSVSLLKFYMRRILRIWPLYYLILIITFILYIAIPYLHQGNDLKRIFNLYAFFLPNYAYVINLTLVPITPLWSIGVEEQFYLIWPWLFKGIKSAEQLLVFLLVFLAAFLLIKVIVRFYGNEAWYTFLTVTRLDCMALGGLAGYLLKQKHTFFLKIIYHPLSQYITLGVFLVTILYKPFHMASIFDGDVYGVLALVLIVNVCSNPASLVKLEAGVLKFIGRISYGLYCYHMLIILVLSLLLRGVVLPNTKLAQVGMFLLVYLTTVGVAYLSYNFIELKFINLKERFSMIFSRNSDKLSLQNDPQ